MRPFPGVRIDGELVASDVTYHPSGHANSVTYGNGVSTIYGIDDRGRVASVTGTGAPPAGSAGAPARISWLGDLHEQERTRLYLRQEFHWNESVAADYLGHRFSFFQLDHADFGPTVQWNRDYLNDITPPLEFGPDLDYRKVRCPNCEEVCYRQGAWLEQRMMLGPRADMDDIVAAVEKVYANRPALVAEPAGRT